VTNNSPTGLHTITYLRIVQVEPKKWRCNVATVKEAEEGAGEEDVDEEDELHNDHGIEPAGNASDNDDDEDEDDEEDEEDDGEKSSEGSWGVPPPKPGKYST
jgi:hypothetical protein